MKKTPRPAFSYRGARRNAWRKTKSLWSSWIITGTPEPRYQPAPPSPHMPHQGKRECVRRIK